MADILIAGYGDIGGRLAALLHAQGHRVTGLKRNPPVEESASIRLIAADLIHAGDLAFLDDTYDWVVYLPTPGDRTPEAYRSVYETGLNNLLNRFETPGRQTRWLFVSSTGVYAQSGGEWVDESSPTEPVSETSRWIYRAEQSLLARRADALIVRFSGIYGPGREHLLRTACSEPEIQYDPPCYTNRIHQDDCAAVLAFLIERGLAGQRLDTIYLASDDDPAPIWEVVSWLARMMTRLQPTPKSAHSPPDQNKRCRNERLKALGFQFKYPSYRDGYRALIDSLKSP